MKHLNKLFISLAIGTTCIFASCRRFLDVEPPNSRIATDVVFSDDAVANSAILGIYITLYSGNNSFASGNYKSVVSLAGLSADELVDNFNGVNLLQFQNNTINPSIAEIQNLWGSMYVTIYQANAALEGLAASTSLTPTLSKQLKGEALFIRAFCYFYLANFFGDVPLAITTDYNINNQLPRSPIMQVYAQIKTDLLAAAVLLTEKYPGDDRTRVNKPAVEALLARVYLYTGEWAEAEGKATNVITNRTLYELPALNTVFLTTSKEAIWQLKSNADVNYTAEGYDFSPTRRHFILRDDLIAAFDPGDIRKTNWITSFTSGVDTFYATYKYKRADDQASFTTFPMEFSTVLRLAEIYLIRAEARAKQDKLSLAIDDVDKIRNRAGIPLIKNTNPTIGQDSLIAVIKQERRIELLVEWGHRWLDLKRWNQAGEVLSSIKPEWSNDDQLYPIPSSEISKNANLKPQNSGY